jgi:hypothetical protein
MEKSIQGPYNKPLCNNTLNTGAGERKDTKQLNRNKKKNVQWILILAPLMLPMDTEFFK